MGPGLGPRIRTLRLQRRLTLQEVADKAGITTIGHLFPASTASDRLVVRARERKRLSPRRGIRYELLNLGKNRLRCIWAIIPPTF